MKRISLIFWFLTTAFVITGLLFLFVPDQLTQTFNTLGKMGNLDFEPLPPRLARTWTVFSFSYMVLVTSLAYLVAKHPERGEFLILVCLGKASSSLTSLAFYFIDQRAFLYLTTFFVDGAIAALSVGCYLYLRREQNYVPEK